MHMSPTFDPAKDAENRRKHGVSLTEGDGVLSDPLALTIEDDSAEGEQRFVTVGLNSLGTLMVVVFTDRDGEPRETLIYRWCRRCWSLSYELLNETTDAHRI